VSFPAINLNISLFAKITRFQNLDVRAQGLIAVHGPSLWLADMQ